MSPQIVALVLLSAALHAFWTTLVKESRDPLAFNWLQAVPLLPAAAWLLVTLDLAALPRDALWLLLASSVVHAAYVIWMAAALRGADLSVVYPIMRSTPAFLPVVAIPLLGEEISRQGAVGVGVVVVGMWLVHTRGVLHPRALLQPGTGPAYAVLAATIAYSLTDKAAMASLSAAPWDSPIPRAFGYFLLLGLGHTAFMTPVVLRRIELRALARQGRAEWRRVLLAALGTAAGYTLILEALRAAPVSYVAAVRQTSVVFAVAIGARRLREEPGLARIAGAVLTVLGVALVSLA